MTTPQLALTLFFDKLPTIDPVRHAAEIAAAEQGLAPTDVNLEVLASADSGSVTHITFENHVIKLVGIAAPLPPKVYELELANAHLKPTDKPHIAAHQAHMIAYYEEGPGKGVERVIALYKIAYALREDGLRGVLFGPTWMIQTPNLLANLFNMDTLNGFRRSPAELMAIWLGYVKFAKPDGSWWLATKGGEVYGVPNFAYLVRSLNEADDVLRLFGDIITYLYRSNNRMAAGHTMQLGDAQLRLRNTYEYIEYLGEDTLVIERNEPPKKRGWFGRG